MKPLINKSCVATIKKHTIERLGRKPDAITWFEKGRAQWQSIRVPTALEKRRMNEIAALDRELALVRKP